jgi:hypothetical protein
VSSLSLAVLFAFWWPITTKLWDVTVQPWKVLLVALGLSGWGIADEHVLDQPLDLFGLRQVVMRLRDRQPPPYSFVSPGFYRIVRHPFTWDSWWRSG